MERARGIEPLASAWKAEVLPLYDARNVINLLCKFKRCWDVEFCLTKFLRPAFPPVGELGFEPRLNPPKGLVLPLHYSPKPSPQYHFFCAQSICDKIDWARTFWYIKARLLSP